MHTFTGGGAVWQRAAFGTQRPGVQISPTRRGRLWSEHPRPARQPAGRLRPWVECASGPAVPVPRRPRLRWTPGRASYGSATSRAAAPRSTACAPAAPTPSPRPAAGNAVTCEMRRDCSRSPTVPTATSLAGARALAVRRPQLRSRPARIYLSRPARPTPRRRALRPVRVGHDPSPRTSPSAISTAVTPSYRRPRLRCWRRVPRHRCSPAPSALPAPSDRRANERAR